MTCVMGKRGGHRRSALSSWGVELTGCLGVWARIPRGGRPTASTMGNGYDVMTMVVVVIHEHGAWTSPRITERNLLPSLLSRIIRSRPPAALDM